MGLELDQPGLELVGRASTVREAKLDWVGARVGQLNPIVEIAWLTAHPGVLKKSTIVTLM
jgi:hypothetical protein